MREENSFNDIGIPAELDWKRIRKLLLIGLAASVMVLIGDLLLGWGVENEVLTGLERNFSRYADRSDAVLFWSALLGLVGIPLEGLCYFGIYRLIASGSKKLAHIFRGGVLGYLIFGGCGVHVPCLAVVYVYKHMRIFDSETAYATMLQFAEYFLLPGTFLFFVFFLILCGAQIAAFAKGVTPYPRWCWIFSLPLPMIAVQAAHAAAGNAAWAHGIAAGWISIGNLWMFGGLLLTMRLAEKGT